MALTVGPWTYAQANYILFCTNPSSDEGGGIRKEHMKRCIHGQLKIRNGNMHFWQEFLSIFSATIPENAAATRPSAVCSYNLRQLKEKGQLYKRDRGKIFWFSFFKLTWTNARRKIIKLRVKQWWSSKLCSPSLNSW